MSGIDIHNPTKPFRFKDEEEQVALEKFRETVENLKQEDGVLIRFLRARERNLKNAEKMLRTSVTWRSDNDISSYLHWAPPKCLKEEFGLSFKITGKDFKGRPVLWFPLGEAKGKECIDAGHKDDMFKWSYHMFESAMHAIKETPDMHQIVVIIGFEGLEMKRILHVEANQATFRIFQNLEQNYPEILRCAVVLNAPWYFNAFYNLMKPILSAQTISKLNVFDSNKEKWTNFLQEIMPPESIPEVYRDT